MSRIWRLQTDVGQNKGAVQILAEISGNKPVEIDACQKLYHESSNVFTDNDKTRVKIDKNNIIFMHDDKKEFLTLLSWDKEKSYLEFNLEEDEALFGTGERFNGVNQRGKKITI